MASYYVAPWGSDSNAGSFSFPKLTIAAGIALLSGGDSLLIRGGTYFESIASNTIPAGSSGAYTQIVGYVGETIWVRPNPGANRVFEFDTTQAYIWIDRVNMDGQDCLYDTVKINAGSGFNAHHIRITNAELIGGPSEQIILATALIAGVIGSNEFINLRCHGGGTSDFFNAFYINSPDNLVEFCEVYNRGGAGIQIYNGSVGSVANNNIVRNNRIHNCGISGQRGQGIILSSGSNNQAYNNLIYDLTGTAAGAAGILVFSGTGHKVYNNTIRVNISIPGIEVDADNCTIRNNIAYTGTGITDAGTGNTFSNNLTTNPSFTDPASGDFTLQAGSAAIDAGFNLSGIVDDDFDGNTRPAGSAWDIGCYEYGGTGGGGGPISGPPETDPALSPPDVPAGGFTPGAGAGGAGSGAVLLSASKKWLVLGRIYADSGLQAFAATRVHHPSWTYEPFVVNWGYIERNISAVSGLPEVNYATIEMADNHRNWRDLLSTETLRRRYFDLKLVPDGGSESAGEVLFVGEVDEWLTEAGKVTFTIKDRLFAWLDEPIPAMLIRELYPDIPAENEGGFLPIIFGQCRSVQNASPPTIHRGVIPCPHYGVIGSPFISDRYGLSMTRVTDVVQVYRTFINGSGFEETELVGASEYSITEVSITAFNVVMFHQFLDFNSDQQGAEITADVDGIYERGAYGPLAAIVPGSPPNVLRNPIDAWINAVYLIMSKVGIVLSVTDAVEIAALRTEFENPIGSPPVQYYCDGAITEPLTAREFLGQFLPSFNLFMPQNRRGLITLKRMIHDSNVIRPIISEGRLILRESFKERPPEKVTTQFVIHYNRNHSIKEKFEKTAIYDTNEQTIYGTLNASSPQVIQPGIEKEDLDLVFVSDDATASEVTVQRAAFEALGSFRQEWAVPTPPVMADVDLGEQIGITHSQGLSLGGYINEEVFVTGITFDVHNLTYLCRSIRRVPQTLHNPLTQPVTTITACPPFTDVILITVDHTQLPTTRMNFIVPVKITDARLKSTGNGGFVTSTSGFDIRPSSTDTCTLYAFELAEAGYDPVSGSLEIYVVVPTVYGSNASVDAMFQLNFGNALLTTNGSTEIWTEMKSVLHLNAIGGGIYATRDSTYYISGGTLRSPQMAWTNHNGVTAVASQIGNGGSFSGGSQYLSLDQDPPTSPILGTADGTVSFWLKTSLVGAATGTFVMGRENFLICPGFNVSVFDVRIMSTGTLRIYMRNQPGTQIVDFQSASAVNDDVWHHIVITRIGAVCNIYIDGALDATNTAGYTVNITNDGGSNEIGIAGDGAFPCFNTLFYVGLLDEYRNTNDTAWDADRVLAEYNAQRPSTFYTVT